MKNVCIVNQIISTSISQSHKTLWFFMAVDFKELYTSLRSFEITYVVPVELCEEIFYAVICVLGPSTKVKIHKDHGVKKGCTWQSFRMSTNLA
ncbi:hypothetical protein ACHQM5_024421 [Ranunculus cassubicifolius]